MPSRHSEGGARAIVRSIIPDIDHRTRKKDKTELDFYRTPPIGTQRLLTKEKFPGTVWEPACGDGAISVELKKGGSRVISSDLVDRGYGTPGRDFLTFNPRFEFDHIVTNPPFTHCMEFAVRALSFRPKKVVMLARLMWLEGKTRKTFFETSGLSRVLVFSGRINISKNGENFGDGGEGGMVAFAWYVWKRGHRGPATIGWI